MYERLYCLFGPVILRGGWLLPFQAISDDVIDPRPGARLRHTRQMSQTCFFRLTGWKRRTKNESDSTCRGPCAGSTCVRGYVAQVLPFPLPGSSSNMSNTAPSTSSPIAQALTNAMYLPPPRIRFQPNAEELASVVSLVERFGELLVS